MDTDEDPEVSPPNRKRLSTFLLVVIGNLDPILHRFRDIAGFVCREPLLPYPYHIPGVFPLE